MRQRSPLYSISLVIEVTYKSYSLRYLINKTIRLIRLSSIYISYYSYI
jgi:hypothetical protein